MVNWSIRYLLLLLFLVSCSTQHDNQYRIVFSQCCHDDWREVMNSEMNRELAFHPEMKLEILESYSNSDKQVQQIRAAIKQKVDLIIISPNETKQLTPVIEEAYHSKIPVILIDRKTESNLYTAYIGADNYEIGNTAGKFLASKFGGKGKIIEIKMEMTITPAVERDRGFHDAIAKFPNMRIVGTIEGNNGLENIDSQLPNILQKIPDANIVFGHTDLQAARAYNVAKKQGREKKMYFVGIDAIPVSRGIQNVKNGTLNATLLYPTGGSEAIQTAVKILEKQPFNKETRLLTTVITSENVNIMLSQINKIKTQQVDIERHSLKLKELNETFSSQRNRLYFITALLSIVIILGAILFFLLREKQRYNKILQKQNHAILEQKDEIVKVSTQAQKATEEKMRFYSYISHEFRTPLSLILTPTEDLLHRKSTDVKENRSTLQLIQKNANRLLRLVDQLLELRKIDAGKMELQASQHDLVAFVKEIVLDFGIKAKKQKIDLQFICPFLTLPYSFDAEKLDKVFFNIISNAFKYTPEGGLIHITLLKNLDKIEITIADNGVGMKTEDKAHAFDLFYRGNQNISFGTGLGLALSHEFVVLHGGEIELNSEKNEGTIFKIVLPLAEQTIDSNTKNLPLANHQKVEVEPNTLENTFQNSFVNTIVLIEDNLDLNAYLSQKLEKSYNVFSNGTAEKGWEGIIKHIPDLIISDVMLPEMDGFSLTQKVKSDFRTSHIPVILLTAKGQIESQIEGTKAGADAYISKPFNQQLLEEKIKSLLENRDRMRKRFSNEVMNPSHVQKGERKFLIEFEALIEKNIKDSSLSVEKLSQELGMSRVQLFRKISALTNKNVTDYIAEFKLQKAKILLNDHQKNIAEIAYETGFNNPSYFTTFFKQKTNQTPSEWRNG